MAEKMWVIGRNCFPIRLGRARRVHALSVAGGVGEAWERTICGAGGDALRDRQWSDARGEAVTCRWCRAAIAEVHLRDDPAADR